MQKLVLTFAALALTTEAARLKQKQEATSTWDDSNYYSDYLSGYGYIESFYDPESSYS